MSAASSSAWWAAITRLRTCDSRVRRSHEGMGVLHLDAHADLRGAYEGFTFSHGLDHVSTCSSEFPGEEAGAGRHRDLSASEYELIASTAKGRSRRSSTPSWRARRDAGETWRAQVERICAGCRRRSPLVGHRRPPTPRCVRHSGVRPSAHGGLAFTRRYCRVLAEHQRGVEASMSTRGRPLRQPRADALDLGAATSRPRRRERASSA